MFGKEKTYEWEEVREDEMLANLNSFPVLTHEKISDAEMDEHKVNPAELN